MRLNVNHKQYCVIIKGISHLASARIVGDVPYYSRRSLAHEFDPLDYSIDRVRDDVYYLSYYAKNRDAVAADTTGKLCSIFFCVPTGLARP